MTRSARVAASMNCIRKRNGTFEPHSSYRSEPSKSDPYSFLVFIPAMMLFCLLSMMFDMQVALAVLAIGSLFVFSLAELFSYGMIWWNTPNIRRIDDQIKEIRRKIAVAEIQEDPETKEVFDAELKALISQRRDIKFWKYFSDPREDCYERAKYDQLTTTSIMCGLTCAVGVSFIICGCNS